MNNEYKFLVKFCECLCSRKYQINYKGEEKQTLLKNRKKKNC